MANKLFKLSMLSTLLFTGLGLTLASCTSGNTNENEENEPEEEEEEESTNLNNHTHDGWVSLSKSDFDSGNYASGTLTGGASEDEATSYYLTEDVTLVDNDITINDYVTLCLNGHTLTGTGSNSVITISSGAYFNLCECTGDDNAIITGGNTQYGGGVYVSEDATFDMYGGIISENTATRYGGGVCLWLSGSVFNMYGGTIDGNSASVYGGGVCLWSSSSSSTFHMYDGTISNNSSDLSGGGVLVYYGEFYMYDGTISNNSSYSNGGNFYISASSSSDTGYFCMYGGTIEGSNNNMYISGRCYIYGGYIKDALHYSSYPVLAYVYGGYFSSTAFSFARNYVVSTSTYVEVSLLGGSDFDDNYKEGYDYAVYTTYSFSEEIIPFDVTYGSLYELEISDESDGLAYTIDINGETTLLEIYPTYVGTYTITAHLLIKSTADDGSTTNYYGTRTIFLTISKGQAVISINSMSKAYDSEPASIDYIVTVGDLDITNVSNVDWYDEYDEPISAPTEVGTYKAIISVEDTEVYYGTTLTISYSIT